MFQETETPPIESVRNSLMIDIETMSTEKNAAILTIGATAFDPMGFNTEAELREKSALFGPISLESNQMAGRHFSGQTVHWWLSLPKEAQHALIEGAPAGLNNVLNAFRQWMCNLTPKPAHVWANSPSFDLEILKNSFDYTGQMWPFGFWAERDVRTIKEAAYPNCDPDGFPPFATGTAHDAVDDCIKQCLQVQHCYHVIQGTEERWEPFG